MTPKQAAKLLGKKGGKKSSPAKTAAILKNLKAARMKRWPAATRVTEK
jgi:hypothetical protein